MRFLLPSNRACNTTLGYANNDADGYGDAEPGNGRQTAIAVESTTSSAMLPKMQLFPSKETWYLLYENFEDDPVFDDDAECLRMKGEMGADGESIVITADFHPSTSMELDLVLASSPGYSVDNVLQIKDPKYPNTNFNLTIAYIEIDTCVVLRHSYIQEGKGCSYWVPESKLGTTNRCCEFIFDLLCGTSPKNNVYVDGQCPE